MNERGARVFASLTTLAFLLCASAAFAGGTSESTSGKKVQLVVWAWDKRATDTTWAASQEFMKLHPNIEVQAVNFGTQDAHDKVLTALVSGVGAPDLFLMEYWAVGRFEAMGALADLTDQLSDYQANYSPAVWALVSYKDRVYGLPFDGGPAAIFYRKDIFDNAGIPFPTNWQDFAAAGRKLAANGIYILPVQGEVATLWLFGRHASVSDYDGKILFDNPQVVDTYQWLGDRIAKDKSIYYKLPWDPSSYELIKSGKIAAVAAGFWYSGFGISDLAYTPDLSGKWRIAGWLPWKAGDGATGSFLGGAGFFVPKQSQHVKEAAEWMKFVLGRPESEYDQATKSGIFPFQLGAMKQLATQTPALYGGQQIYQTMMDELSAAPPVIYGPNYAPILNALNTALDRIALQGVPAADAIRDAAAQADRERVVK